MVGSLTHYELRIVTFANVLFLKQILNPNELVWKMDEVRACHVVEPLA